MSEQTDEYLVRQLAQDRKDAFSTLFDRYYARVFHAGVLHWGISQMAHDLSRDVFTRIWEKRKELSGTVAFSRLLSEITWEEIKRIDHASVDQQSMFPGSPSEKDNTDPLSTKNETE